MLSKATYSSSLWERGVTWGREHAQTDFICNLSQLSLWLQLTAGNDESSVCDTLQSSRGLASESRSPFSVGFGSMHADKIPRHKAKSMTRNIKGV